MVWRRDRKGYSKRFFEEAVVEAFAPIVRSGCDVRVSKPTNFGFRADLETATGRLIVYTSYVDGVGVELEQRDADGNFVNEWPGLRMMLPDPPRARPDTFDEPPSAATHGDALRSELNRCATALFTNHPEVAHGDFSALPIRRWPPQT